MTATDFTTKRHVSCNGCFFNQSKNRCKCTKKEYESLLFAIWSLFGICTKKEIIYILKTNT